MAILTPTQIAEETRNFFSGPTEAPVQQRESVFDSPTGNPYANSLTVSELLPPEASTSLRAAASDLDRAIDYYSPGTIGISGISTGDIMQHAGTYTTASTVTTIDPEVILETTDSRGDKKTVGLNEFYQEFSDLKQRNEELESRVYKLEEHIRFLTEI